jgi:hypothetical protein
MNDQDKEAFDKWFLGLDESHLSRVIKLNRGASQKAWQAACEYMRNKSNPLDTLSLYEKLERERAENAKLREALEFTISAAEHLYKPNIPLERGLCPTFYFTLSYEGDLELMEKTKKAREALKEIE